MAYETTIDLAVCSDCGGRFVQPLEVATSTSGGWDVTLHCPEWRFRLALKCDAILPVDF